MRSKITNKEHIEGYVYDHSLALKTVKTETKADGTPNPNFGKEFINGSLDIQTDDEGLNIVTVYFTYVTATTKKGTKNETFSVLKSIIDGAPTVTSGGAEGAKKVKIDTALALNDFFTENAISDTNPQGLISQKRHEGGFVSTVTKLNPDASKRNTFEYDMLINGTRFLEGDPEQGTEDCLVVKGAIFNFRNAILPVELKVRDKGGIGYFESLDASSSNMIFTKVKGLITSQTVVKRKEETGAFGGNSVDEYTNSVKEWLITWASGNPYEIGDEKEGITVDEIKAALADRETYLANEKKRVEEYQASKEQASSAFSTPAATASAPAAVGGFNF